MTDMPAMPPEVVSESEVTEEYPGLEFTPPQGSVDDGATEGEAMVTWKKVGDKFTITEFEGQPMEASAPTTEPSSTLDELKAMEKEGV